MDATLNQSLWPGGMPRDRPGQPWPVRETNSQFLSQGWAIPPSGINGGVSSWDIDGFGRKFAQKISTVAQRTEGLDAKQEQSNIVPIHDAHLLEDWIIMGGFLFGQSHPSVINIILALHESFLDRLSPL